MRNKLLAALLLGATVLSALQGCFPIVAAGVGTGVMVAVDRRSLGAQTEDESIEWKAATRVRDRLGERGHFNFTSFNRKVLISGEAASAETKAEVGTIVAQIPNVRTVYNELTVGSSSSLTDRSNDSFITSKVKSRSVDNGKFNPLYVKVVTEAGAVYLLGMLTQAEADAAIQVARTTSGVKKVVPLFEILTPAQARELDAAPSGGSGDREQGTGGG
ncbi:MAG: BON domain-containing protein [Candidatus Accumulibacter sp.]|jgi:osmotically-inducible protein OsmY|nr:BON domain-containing protein [Accumulibacter sp.]